MTERNPPDATPKRVIAGVPVKPFGVAKQRLSPILDPTSRARLGKAMARRTMHAATEAGVNATIVTGSDVVRAWAAAAGLACIDELAPSLDGAAAGLAADATARGAAWLFIHADLPLISPRDVISVVAGLRSGHPVLAPARDGGTNLLGGTGDGFGFTYGPGSFHRHLRAVRSAAPVIVTRPGLAFEIDTPRDLLLAAAMPAGAWLANYLDP